MRLIIRYTSKFKKDLKKSLNQGKDIEKLLMVVDLIANRVKLDSKYRDHSLSGNFSQCRECHIEPDWILIYQIINDELILSLNRVGSHSDLFE